DAITTAVYTLSLHDALPICENGSQCTQIYFSANNVRLDEIIVDCLDDDHNPGNPKGRNPGGLGNHRHKKGENTAQHSADIRNDRDRKSTRLNSSHVKTSYAV